jgi:hypothetical protein
MNIQEIFSRYTEAVAQLHLYQRAVKANAAKELVELDRYAKTLENHPDLKELPNSVNNMIFRHARDGGPRVFAHKKTSLEEKATQVFYHKNKQYQWLLSEAYELFADFVEDAYAYAGYVDNNFWPLSDFGSITLSELRTKDFEWFANQARAKRDVPQSALNRFREKLPDFADLEKNNKINLDLKLLVILVEHLRHLIVHMGGVSKDKEKFIENVMKKTGYSTKGDAADEQIKFINGFFADGKQKNTVVLLEVRVNPEIPLDIHVDIFDMLSSGLVSCAHALGEALIAYEANIENVVA